MSCLSKISPPSQPQLKATKPHIEIGPMEHVSADICHISGDDWVVIANKATGIAWLWKLASLSTCAVWDKLKKTFDAYVYPTSVSTDGGPQFGKEFDSFCNTAGIEHDTSSPYNPMSNGRAVKSMKYLILKAQEDKTDIASAWLS